MELYSVLESLIGRDIAYDITTNPFKSVVGLFRCQRIIAAETGLLNIIDSDDNVRFTVDSNREYTITNNGEYYMISPVDSGNQLSVLRIWY
jgi:hypothetical protein